MDDSRREAAKDGIKDLLRHYTADSNVPFNPSKPGSLFTCPNPAHQDKNPSCGYDRRTRRFKCFSCGCGGDAFDLVALCEDLDPRSKETFDRTYELLSLKEAKPSASSLKVIIEARAAKAREAREAEGKRAAEQDEREDAKRTAVKSLIAEARKALPGSPALAYLQERGIGPKNALRASLGYLRGFAYQAGVPVAGSANGHDVLVLPTSDSSANCRVIDLKQHEIETGSRFYALGPKAVFNAQALAALWDSRSGLAPVFAVEGEIDALSVEEAGGRAIGMGSASNVALTVNAVKAAKARHALTMPVIVALDNDEAGIKRAEELEAALHQAGIKAYRSDIWARLGVKDANDALTKDQAALEAAIKDDILAAQGLGPEAAEEFENSCSSAMLLSALSAEVRESANREPFSTGLKGFDAAFGGGFPAGLTVLGGESSAGKTSFALQIASGYAESGGIAIYVSLETGKLELLAKQVSRETYFKAKREYQPVEGEGSYAQDAWTCVNGRAQGKLNEDQRHFIWDAAVEQSERMGRRFYVLGGVEAWSVEDIEDEVRKAIKFTSKHGKKPMVVVDYLQIVRATDPKMDNIRSLDHVVSSLKHLSVSEGIPVILLCALNRMSEGSEEKSFRDLKGSSGIEYGADTVMILGLVKENADDDPRRRAVRDVRLAVKKRRLGPGHQDFTFRNHAVYGAFEEPDEGEVEF